MTCHIFKIDDHSGWGNSIQWFDWGRRRITGHLEKIPEIGDEIQSTMQSGKIARFRVIEVRRCWDPGDQFFGTVEDIGFVNESEQE